MTLLFYIVLNIFFLVFFIKKKKNLHILEILLYWLAASYFFQNYSALCYMNFKTLIIPDKLSYELSHFINRIILYPLLMVSFLHFHLNSSTKIKKILLLLSYILLLTGLEWLEDFFGVLNHVNWQIWWSFSFWVLSLCVLLGLKYAFRKVLYKGRIKL
ncbi:hypothetical protein ABE41_010390 [Fictibacillus arsenicus]|uniref:Uncharacterized protein n=1 Tax=Fictibacillus arsenicus TaxID=255247 RepID=A0A1B1Z4P2_9BACL|nr:hypothetical protein ABE41_010390 [Fictibacillus arsenicus]